MQNLLLTIIISIFVAGCNSNYIRVVDLDQETKTCRSDNSQQAFVYPNAEFGVCMDKKLANYLYCVNTISLIKVSSGTEKGIEGGIGAISGILDSARLSTSDKKIIIQSMASEGKLAEARANAIEFCKTFSK